MRLSDLQSKDIINISDGKKIGEIIDINMNNDGSLNSLIVEKSKFLVSLFSTKDEVEIKWDDVEKIGEDVILVKINI